MLTLSVLKNRGTPHFSVFYIFIYAIFPLCVLAALADSDYYD